MIISVQIICIFSIMLDNNAEGIFLSMIYFVRFYFTGHYYILIVRKRAGIHLHSIYNPRTNCSVTWTFFVVTAHCKILPCVQYLYVC